MDSPPTPFTPDQLAWLESRFPGISGCSSTPWFESRFPGISGPSPTPRTDGEDGEEPASGASESSDISAHPPVEPESGESLSVKYPSSEVLIYGYNSLILDLD